MHFPSPGMKGVPAVDREHRSHIRKASGHALGNRVSEIDRVRAVEGMNQAMMLGNLTIAALGRARHLFRTLRDAATRIVVSR
jgi:hypothetical protein